MKKIIERDGASSDFASSSSTKRIFLNDSHLSRLDQLFRHVPKPQGNLHKSPRQILSQDEFKKNSPYCTAYCSFHKFFHETGRHFPKEQRREIIDFLLAEQLIHDSEERSGGSTVDVAERIDQFVAEEIPGINTLSLFVEMGSAAERKIRSRGHAIASSFVISEQFVRDRGDNNLLDGYVHGGKKFNGHAVCHIGARLRKNGWSLPSVVIVNNYGVGKLNFIIHGESKIREWNNPLYHRRYGVFTAYIRN